MGGFSELLRKPININTCYEAQGAYLFDTLKTWSDNPSHTPEQILTDIEKHAVPGTSPPPFRAHLHSFKLSNVLTAFFSQALAPAAACTPPTP